MLHPLPSTMAERLHLLRAFDLLEELPEEALAALAHVAQPGMLHAGEVAFAEGHGHNALLLVLDGALEAIETDAKGVTRCVRRIGRGEAVDELQTLAGLLHGVRVRATAPVRALGVPAREINALCRQHDALRLVRERMHRRQLLCRLSPVFGTCDRELLDTVEEMGAWLSLARGTTTPATTGGTLHLVISGRVQAVEHDAGDALRVIDEAGRGDALGEHTLFNDAAAPLQLRAVRDSVLAAFTAQEIEQLIAQRPAMLRNVLRLATSGSRGNTGIGMPAGCVTNVALMPATEEAPVRELAPRLAQALEAYGPVLRLTAEMVDALTGEPGLAQSLPGTAAETALLAWLDVQESAYRFVLYQADEADTPWARRCVRMADRALVVARAGGDPAPSALERALFAGQDLGAHETLVLVHADGTRPPGGTRAWRTARPTFEDHLHLRWDRDADIERLGRLLAGRAVGLVLGGGGARGFAHIGVLRALEEAGIPVDAIGGTSMGASLAAQYAMGMSPQQMAQINERVWLQLRPHTKYTLPVLSLVGNRKSTFCGQLMYGDIDIEDCWLPFFCVSSNLTTAEMHVHRRGSLLWAATASASIPAFAVPVLDGAHLLVDGGLLNNVPADVMRALGCGTVIAVEVSPGADDAFTAERVPSPWEVIRSRFLSRGPRLRFPSLLEVAMRATMLNSVQREKVAMADADLCLHPPIDGFGLMAFDQLHAIVETGYAYARNALRDWRPPHTRPS
ncbi:patatin-like phospholipase family protein [Luteimonas suaedae]|uniref:patatin-like phospholipase family protein n=1 Tax=Luteimonas suaedae TaxID=2605430 RepID=UPI0011F06CBA|nr:patatin-like phospholipase family protein [Luteimonas suaedae]